MKPVLHNIEPIYQALFEAMSDPILLLKEGCFIDCNAATLKLLGYQHKADFIKLSPSDISPPLQADGCCSLKKSEEIISKALSEGRQYFEWLHQHVDGLIIPVEVILTPIVMEGEIILHVVWHDMSFHEQTKSQLQVSENKLRSFYDASPEAITILNSECFLECNKTALQLFGCNDEMTFIGLHPADISPMFQDCGQSSFDLANSYVASAIEKGSAHFEWRHKRLDTGQLFPAEVQLFAVEIEGIPYIQSFIRDISVRKAAEKALQDSEFRWKFALEGSGDGVWDWNIETNEASYSTLWKQMLGYGENDILPTNDEWVTRIHSDDMLYVTSAMQAYLVGQAEMYVVEYRLRCKDNSYKWILGRGMVVSRDAEDKPLRMIGTHTDITQRKIMEEQMRQLAFYDALTQVANRLLLNDRLKLAIANNKRSGHYLAILFIDMDKLKSLNDDRGHLAGDLLLIEVAQRLKSCVREHDTVARFGGDEFVVMLTDLADTLTIAQTQAALVADKILKLLSEPYQLNLCNEERAECIINHQCTASIGVALTSIESALDDILKWADAAMYNAKAAGRNAIFFHEANNDN